MSLTDQHVVVIGGTSGLGLATARAAAEAGARVTIASSSQEKLDAALAVLPDGVRGRATDVRDEASLAALFDGPLDHLVYSAGDALSRGGVADRSVAEAQALFDVRFWGAYAAVRAALPQLSERGSVTLTSGTIAVRPFPDAGLGTGLANGVEGLARGLAVELAPVRVNAVRPGAVLTPMWEGAPAEMVDSAAARTLTGQIGAAEQVAAAHLFLMQNDYVTGTVLTIDGGSVLV